MTFGTPIIRSPLLSAIKNIKVSWKGQLYQFTAMPNGLTCAPRYFTKLLKPVFSILREKGHISSGYLDDVLILGEDYDAYKKKYL